MPTEQSLLVYGRMTGWEQDGPSVPMAGHDVNCIATGLIGRKCAAPAPCFSQTSIPMSALSAEMGVEGIEILARIDVRPDEIERLIDQVTFHSGCGQ